MEEDDNNLDHKDEEEEQDGIDYDAYNDYNDEEVIKLVMIMMMKERRNEQLKTDKFAGKLTNYFLFEHVYTAQHQQMYSPSPASPLLRT